MRTMNELWAIEFLQTQLLDLVVFVEKHYYRLPERVRRLISHFGGVRLRGTCAALTLATGVDFTNCIYAIVWRILLEEAPPRFQLQSISNLNSCGNMVESLMAIAFFGPFNVAHVMEHLSGESWASTSEVGAAAIFLRWALDSGWQEIVAFKIPLLERLILLVHQICRVENPCNIFSRLNNRELDRHTLEQYVADLKAMRLGWGSAHYARPGCVYRGRIGTAGDIPIWVFCQHPSLSDELISQWMRNGAILALSNLNEPPGRFFALLDPFSI